MKAKTIIEGQKGAAIVEFAVVLPFLVLLVAGIIEFSLAFYNKQVITNASREGAREGVTNTVCSGNPCTESQLKTIITPIVNDYCLNRLITFAGTNLPKDIDPEIIVKTPPDRDDLKVIVRYDYYYLLPSILGFGSSKEIAAYTTMKMEAPP